MKVNLYVVEVARPDLRFPIRKFTSGEPPHYYAVAPLHQPLELDISEVPRAIQEVAAQYVHVKPEFVVEIL